MMIQKSICKVLLLILSIYLLRLDFFHDFQPNQHIATEGVQKT